MLTGKATQTCKAYPNGFDLVNLVKGESLELSPSEHAFFLKRGLIEAPEVVETKPEKIEIETKPAIPKVTRKRAKQSINTTSD